MANFSNFANYLFGAAPVSSSPYTQQSTAMNAGAGQYAGDAQSAFNSENGLASNLWGAINGAGPSVASSQLQQSLGQNLNNGLAMGAGGSGENSVLARYLASQQTGNQADQIAQQQALLRAQEIAAARAQYGQVTANMGNQAGNLYGTNLQTGLGYAQTAAGVDTNNANRQQSTSNAVMGGLLSGGGAALGGYFSGGAGGAAGSGAGASMAAAGGAYTGLSPSSYGQLYSQQQPGYAASQGV
jgi:hypothetical protein